MKIWKRNAVVVAILLFVCVAVYLNWSYQQENDSTDVGKTLGQAALVNATADPLLNNSSANDANTEGSEEKENSATAETGASGQDSYFASARLNRQQARDSALSILQQTTDSEDVTAELLADTNQAIQTLASYTVSEAQIENLVTAKGYQDCVAFIGENSISVVVSATEDGLQDSDVARIKEIVTEETGYAASQVKIIEAN